MEVISLDTLYRVKEALNILKISRDTFYRKVKEGKIKVVKFGYHTRITETELKKIIKEGF